MSLTKLLTAPIKLFQKDVITFLIVRRYDLGITEDLIRYIAVKPSASVSTLRRKVWYLLDLPDYCEEVIILKTSENVPIPLLELRRGNEPGRPFILEVWLKPPTIQNNMLTMGREEEMAVMMDTIAAPSECSCDCDKSTKQLGTASASECHSSMTNESLILNKLRCDRQATYLPATLKTSEVSTRISNSSFLIKLQGKRSQDSFANILLKIQTDLCMLSNKLSSLENRIPA